MDVQDYLQTAIQMTDEVIQAKRGTGELNHGAVSDDPVEWCQKTLGTYYHKKQRELMYSIRDNRWTACHAAHGVGKDFAVASFICWWVCRYLMEGVRVVCTAPSTRQVKEVLFQEIQGLHHMGHLPGEVLTQQWKATTEKGYRKVAMGSAPKAGQARQTFQGHHSPHLLVVVDEANGVADDVYMALDGMMTSKGSRLVCIGNPDFAEGEFYLACEDEETDYNVLGISMFDTPHFTGEEVPEAVLAAMPDQSVVDRFARKYGVNSAVYRSKVMGVFTSGTASGWFPFEWIVKAREYEAIPEDNIIVVSADIGAGGDPSVVMVRHGDMIREVTPDTTATEADGKKVGKAIAEIARQPGKFCEEAANRNRAFDERGHPLPNDFDKLAESIGDRRASEVHIDLLNIGAKAYAACEVELKEDKDINVEGCNVQEKANNADAWHNRKAELAEIVRERLCEGSLDIDPNDDKLMEEMRSVKMVPIGSRQKVLDKKSVRKELHRSTDLYDALALSFNVKAVRKVNMGQFYSALVAANGGLERESPHRLH